MRFSAAVFAGALAVMAGCASTADTVVEQVEQVGASTTTDTTTSSTTTADSTTTSTTTTEVPTGVPGGDVGFTTIPPGTATAQYWSPSEFVGSAPSLRYVLTEPLDQKTSSMDELRAALPFGTPPATHGIWREWISGDSGFASGGVLGPIWPVECLGLRPDIDGDLIVDDCDPISIDGPLADFDGDGVANGVDVCPAFPNPAQLKGEPLNGLECSVDDPELNGNEARLIVPRTVDEQNALRAERGLEPISWPISQETATGEFAQWCVGAADIAEGDVEAFRAHMLVMPQMFAMTDDDRARFADVLVEMNEIVVQLEQSDDRSVEERMGELQAEGGPFFVMLGSTNVEC